MLIAWQVQAQTLGLFTDPQFSQLRPYLRRRLSHCCTGVSRQVGLSAPTNSFGCQ